MADSDVSPVKVYNISGQTPVLGTIHPNEVSQAIASGQYSFPKGQPVKVVNPDGELGTIDPAEAPKAFQAGYQYATPDLEKQIKFGSTGEQVKAGLEGVAEGVAGPLAPAAERAFGVKPEDIRARAEVNPYTKMAGQAVGLGAGLLTGTGEGELLNMAGRGAMEATGLANATSTAGKIAGHTIGQAAEMAALSSGDEISKMILQDPNQSVDTALSNIGISGLIGAAGGAAFGSVPPLWKATVGDRAGQFIEDFKGRLGYHVANPDPLGALTDELTNYHKNMTGLADDVYGAQGLKAQEIQKLMPEMSDNIAQQATDVSAKLDGALVKLEGDPFAAKLQRAADEFKAATADSQNPADIFGATEKLKQQVQEWGKFHKDLVPLAEKDFRQTAKDLGFELRTALEDPDVWGKAAERQQSINNAFKEYLPTLKDFEKRFTVEVGGERVVDPAKVSTYLNQLGKPQAEIKQEMLKNFLEASEKYRGVINKTHANLGVESPFQHSSLAQSNMTLEKLSPGAKAADVFAGRALSGLAGKGLGSVVGTGAGALVGHPWLGAIVGEHALGPFFQSILPSIVKPLMDTPANGPGLKAAVDYGLAIAKGQKTIQKATAAILKPGAEVAGIKAAMTDKERNRLDERLKDLNNNPDKMMAVGGETAYYMPHHAVSIGESAGRIVSYLNSIRPQVEKGAPLDGEFKVSQPEKAEYHIALNLAEQPLSILSDIKSGTIRPQDVAHLKNMYPSLYEKLSTSIHEQITEHVSDGKDVPYKQRLGLSLFLGEPLDSTMKPENIAQAQAALMSNPQSPGQQAPQGPKRGSMNGLNKMSSMYQTPQQARISQKSTV